MTGRSGGPPVLGIDLGGTKTLVGVVGADNRILGRANERHPPPKGAPPSWLPS